MLIHEERKTYRVKLNLRHAVLILIAGMLLIIVSIFLKDSHIKFSDPIVMSGLALEFIGVLWLVLSLNQRRRKNKL